MRIIVADHYEELCKLTLILSRNRTGKERCRSQLGNWKHTDRLV